MSRAPLRSRPLRPFAAAALVATLAGCPSEPQSPVNAAASKWQSRAAASYANADLEDAETAIREALKEKANDQDAKVLGAKIALARLDFATVERLTRDLTDGEALGLRGRGYWYAGDVENTARTLELELKKPEVKDPWAKQVVALARDGRGRHPFAMSGSALVAPIVMPTAGPLLVVPCVVDDQEVLAIVVTGVPELMLDTSVKSSPSWVSLGFGEIEVKDVPALPMDLTALSEELKAPIKALIGVNTLRHLHATFDRRGAQFVVRKEDAPPPPEATKIPLAYARGAAMVFRAGLTKSDDDMVPFLVDTNVRYPLALQDEAWKRAGVDFATFTPDSGLSSKERAGIVPLFRLGAFDIPQIPAVQGADLGAFQSKIDMHLAGVAGAALFVPFRVTFGDEGRFAWLERDASLLAPVDEPPAPTTAPTTPTKDAPKAPAKEATRAKDAPKKPATPAAPAAPAAPAKAGGK